MDRPKSLGEGLTSSIATAWSSPGLNCRSPVTPRIPRTPRIPHGQKPVSQQGHSLPQEEDEDTCPILPSGLTFSLPTISSHAARDGRSKKGRISRPPNLKPECLHTSSLCQSHGEDNFLPLSALSITPCLINQPKHATQEHHLTTFSAVNLILGKTVGVGVYSVPSAIFAEVGSVGMTLLVWVVGAIISFCGMSVYLDLGTAMPRSGGERVYLERIFRQPRMLATCMFMAYVVLLGFSTPNCIILGNYAVSALGFEPNVWSVRGLAVFVVTLACLIHARAPSTGLRIINILGVGKMLILAAVILSGVASVSRTSTSDTPSVARQNFTSIWEGTSTKPYNYATALLQVLYCFRGYNTANQVMSEVRNPISTIKIAAPVALSIASVGYVLANVAYFCAVEKEDFRTSGVVIASHFLRNVFGPVWGEQILPCFIIVSAFGNIAATSFAQARVNQELGAQGLLPMSKFWRKKNAAGAPGPGLFLHWLVSVLVIVLPPPGEIYNFLLEIGGYPVSVLSVAISAGLLYLQLSRRERWQSPCPAKRLHTLVFLLSNFLLLIFPWINPGEGQGNSRFAYYAYPATSLGILGMGGLYWVFWRLRYAETSTPGTPLLQRWGSSDTSTSPIEDEGGDSVGLLRYKGSTAGKDLKRVFAVEHDMDVEGSDDESSDLSGAEQI
ncbi:amino acid transporter-like protein [Exophiala viscosa]|uniref:amino acid transporter-like protein n=1 Tax=Exophiala viscosa TaxID=2486360 RepID=UPI00218C9820|nr:amino acid transporter-like protein [Exophiala viscosa]